MDNENKNIQGQETNSSLSPEEKVKEDISSKIADAAAEVQNDIDEANGYITDTEEVAEEIAEYDAEEIKEPVKVSLKKKSFILSLIASALVGALITVFCFSIPSIISIIPEGKTVVKIGNDEITDLDINYYIYAEASEYANENGIADLAAYDWDQEIDGKKLSDTIKEKALDAAINEVLTLQKGAENDITLTEEEQASIDNQIAGITSTYGEDGFKLRARSMGISSIKQYTKMYQKVMATQAVQDDITTNPENYYPEDQSVLNDYIQEGKGSVKHILINTEASTDESADEATEEAAPAEDKHALAQSILDRINNGEDFDTLMQEYNEDTSEPDSGYTFASGEMVPEFEEAAFALRIGEISGLVQSSYGYHIIKRVPGLYELQGYWRADADKDIKIKNGRFNKLSVTDVMNDVAAALEELQAQSSAK